MIVVIAEAGIQLGMLDGIPGGERTDGIELTTWAEAGTDDGATHTDGENDETGTLTIAVLGIEAIAENGTDDGITDQATTTADGSE
jgi:hypothetical protein